MVLSLSLVVAVLKTTLVVVGTAYALYGIRLFLRQNAIVFQPSREIPGDPGSIGLEFEDIFVEAGPGVRVHGWWIPGRPGSNLILFLPGSIGNLACDLETFSFLTSLGATVMAIEYPGFGKSSGRPSEAGCYRSANAAWDFAVRVKGVQPGNILLYGRSVGAAVAVRLAARFACAGLICHSGVTSVPDVAARRYRFFPVRWFCYIRFSTLRFISSCRSPALVMHSRTDWVIPFSHGVKIFDRAPSPKHFLPLIGGHYGNEWLATPGLRDALKPMIERGSIPLVTDRSYAR
jgi:pimeloyl-ACP methyl ester carboxylesterase